MTIIVSPNTVVSGLVLYYDTINIKSYPGSGTTINDISGNSNTGTLTNGPTFDGNALVYDGTNDYTLVPSASSLNFGTGDFTISVWINFQDLVIDGNTFISKDDLTNGFLFNINIDGLGFQTKASNASTSIRYDLANFNINNWYNITGVRKSNILYLYVNGVLTGSIAESTSSSTTSSANLRLAEGADTILEVCNCKISAVQMYNRALTSSEIIQNFKGLAKRYNIDVSYNPDINLNLDFTKAKMLDKRLEITRACTTSVVDFEGNIRYCLSGEIPFQGARRVENLIPTPSGSLTVGNAKTVNITLPGTYIFSMGLGVSSGVATFSGTAGATGTLIQKATNRISIPFTLTAGTCIITASVANLIDLQLEFTGAQANQNPSEYVSVGVLAAYPYHGSGVDGVKNFNYQNGNTVGTNTIGAAGGAGFGLDYLNLIPTNFTAMTGSSDKTHANYGNYTYTDGSIMCWIPAFYYRIGSDQSPNYATYGLNAIDIAGTDTYATEAIANAAGFALHRAFYNNGVVKAGFFVDKYMCSNNAGKASSIALGNPLSSSADHNPFSGLTGTPANNYGGAFAAVKTRDASFFPMSIFIHGALAMLSVAHGQAATASTYCTWYDAGRTTNFPKGNNNNSLKDINDTSVTFTGTGHATYPNCAKTGSASNLAKTAHNGQTNGVVDLNGNLWEITSGFVASTSWYYMLKTSCDIGTLNGGNSLATDAWGATSYAANYDSMGATFGVLECNSTTKLFGNSTNQVFDAALSGDAWKATSAGVPKAGGAAVGAGTAMMGMDVLYDYPKPNEMCPIVGGHWANGSAAGVWALTLTTSRAHSYFHVGVRAALYL